MAISVQTEHPTRWRHARGLHGLAATVLALCACDVEPDTQLLLSGTIVEQGVGPVAIPVELKAAPWGEDSCSSLLTDGELSDGLMQPFGATQSSKDGMFHLAVYAFQTEWNDERRCFQLTARREGAVTKTLFVHPGTHLSLPAMVLLSPPRCAANGQSRYVDVVGSPALSFESEKTVSTVVEVVSGGMVAWREFGELLERVAFDALILEDFGEPQARVRQVATGVEFVGPPWRTVRVDGFSEARSIPCAFNATNSVPFSRGLSCEYQGATHDPCLVTDGKPMGSDFPLVAWSFPKELTIRFPSAVQVKTIIIRDLVSTMRPVAVSYLSETGAWNSVAVLLDVATQPSSAFEVLRGTGAYRVVTPASPLFATAIRLSVPEGGIRRLGEVSVH